MGQELDVTFEVFEALVRGSEAQRSAAVATICGAARNVNRARLRLIIEDALEHDYFPGRETREQDDTYLWARSWLLNVLGRIADDDAKAAARVRRHLDPDVEPAYWVQYWILESMVTAKATDLPELARQILDREDRHDPLVTMLARAILAAGGDDDALKVLQEALGDDAQPGRQWAPLRALRVVPISKLFGRILELVDKGGYSDVTFDAIVALGTVPRGSSRAEQAARTLGNFIAKHRRSGLLDGMRTAALKVLGKLGDENATPILIEELTTDNPTEAREAAIALEKVVGIRVAAARVVEAASRAGAAQAPRFARALQWMDREALADELETLMVSGRAEEQTVARQLLSEIGGTSAYEKLRARTTAVAQYAAETEKVEEKVRSMFEASIAEARTGFKIASAMDIAVFVVGILLLACSAAVVIVKEGKLDSWLGVGMTGSIGAAGILYSLVIARPRRQIVESVDHLMMLKIVFLAYLRQLHQADQAYTRALLENKPMGTAEVQEFAGMVETSMQVAVELLGVLRLRQATRTARVAATGIAASKTAGTKAPEAVESQTTS